MFNYGFWGELYVAECEKYAAWLLETARAAASYEEFVWYRAEYDFHKELIALTVCGLNELNVAKWVEQQFALIYECGIFGAVDVF